MFFLNLTGLEFFGLLAVLGGAITALYFLDRSKRRKVVSTLQFWVSAAGASEQRSRKRVNQPWSLLLQLVSLLLLLLALAQLQWGSRSGAGRNHVLLLDTSAWSAASLPGGTALATEIDRATRYVTSLPPQDRVLVARADALTLPVTPFLTDRDQIRSALRESASSLSALNLAGALAFAVQAQRASGGAGGEIVYAGPQRVTEDSVHIALPPNLRVLSIPVPDRNVGIRRVEVHRGDSGANSWQAQIVLANYSPVPEGVQLNTQFAGTRFLPRHYELKPHGELSADYDFVTNTEGVLTTEIQGSDVLPQDNLASLRLPGNDIYSVAVYTRRPELIKPLLNSDRRIVATFPDPSRVGGNPHTDLAIFDGVPVARTPNVPAIFIDPSSGGSPFAVKEVVAKADLKNWNSQLLMSAGLHAREEAIQHATIFEKQVSDLPLATIQGSTGEGAVVVLRPAAGNLRRMAAIGFDPLGGRLRFSLTTPLLFANLLEWMAPEAVRAVEIRAGHVGTASVVLEPDEASGKITVTSADGATLPFTVHEQTLQLFASKPTTANIRSASRDRIVSLSLPDVATATWQPDLRVAASGLPVSSRFGASALDLWQWLACLGGAGLWAEWILFGRSRRFARLAVRSGSSSAADDRAKELVAQ